MGRLTGSMEEILQEGRDALDIIIEGNGLHFFRIHLGKYDDLDLLCTTLPSDDVSKKKCKFPGTSILFQPAFKQVYMMQRGGTESIRLPLELFRFNEKKKKYTLGFGLTHGELSYRLIDEKEIDAHNLVLNNMCCSQDRPQSVRNKNLPKSQDEISIVQLIRHTNLGRYQLYQVQLLNSHPYFRGWFDSFINRDTKLDFIVFLDKLLIALVDPLIGFLSIAVPEYHRRVRSDTKPYKWTDIQIYLTPKADPLKMRLSEQDCSDLFDTLNTMLYVPYQRTLKDTIVDEKGQIQTYISRRYRLKPTSDSSACSSVSN